MEKRIYLSPPHFTGEEQKYIQQAFESNWIAPTGHNLDTFEKMLCQYTGASYGLALNSGTSAIHLALKALEIKTGDIVLCQSFTFIASVTPILYQGAVPVFIDSEPHTWNMCPDALQEAIDFFINKKQKPKAILVVHLYGQMAQMDQISAIAHKYDIPILEDAAEALGASWHHRAAGTWGKVGVFSFNGNKIISTSTGGMLVCEDKNIREKALFWATQSKEPFPYYEHTQVGYNYRMSNVLAGLGCGQMEVLQNRIQKRREIFSYYKESLKEIKAITFMEELPESYATHWLTCVILDPQKSLLTPEQLRAYLEKHNIETRPLWKPMHLQPLFLKNYYFGRKNIAKKKFEHGLCLPSGSNLTHNELEKIVSLIKKAFKKQKL